MQTEDQMPKANFDDIFDALLHDLDVQWRKVWGMADTDPCRPREILRLEEMREALNLLRRSTSTAPGDLRLSA